MWIMIYLLENAHSTGPYDKQRAASETINGPKRDWSRHNVNCDRLVMIYKYCCMLAHRYLRLAGSKTDCVFQGISGNMLFRTAENMELAFLLCESFRSTNRKAVKHPMLSVLNVLRSYATTPKHARVEVNEIPVGTYIEDEVHASCRNVSLGDYAHGKEGTYSVAALPSILYPAATTGGYCRISIHL